MPSGTKYRQGDVVLAPINYSDLTNAKRRPNLVVSNSQLNNNLRDNSNTHEYWLVPVSSSQIDQPGVIRFSPQDQKMVPQDRPSVIKPWKVLTLAEPLIYRKIGRVSADTLQVVIEKLISFTEYDTQK